MGEFGVRLLRAGQARPLDAQYGRDHSLLTKPHHVVILVKKSVAKARVSGSGKVIKAAVVLACAL